MGVTVNGDMSVRGHVVLAAVSGLGPLTHGLSNSKGPTLGGENQLPTAQEGPGPALTTPHTYQQDVSHHCPVARQKQLPQSQEHLQRKDSR